MIIKPRPSKPTASYLAFARSVRELHRLVLEGRDESPAADAVREASELPWHALSDAERARVSGLSGDLYSISDPTPETRPMNPQAQSKLNAFYEARERGEWDLALDLLRRWGEYIDPPLLAYLRGTVWMGLGDVESASLFFERAHQLEESNSDYLAAYMRYGDKSARDRLVVQVLQSPGDYRPAVIGQAVGLELEEMARATPDGSSAERYRRYVSLLEEAIDRIGHDPDSRDAAFRIPMLLLSGLCHEQLGDNQAAAEFYSRGLAIEPGNPDLLSARGMVRYSSGPEAIRDLERAVGAGAALMWPYFFLAHHSFRERRFRETLGFCAAALEREGPDDAKSELNEWLAIARAELGFPDGMVREAFEEALRLDPSNDRARRNLATYEEFVGASKSIGTAPFEARSPHAVQARAFIDVQATLFDRWARSAA